MPDDPLADAGVERHPDADKLHIGTGDEPCQCICGAPLPARKDWIGNPHPWPYTVCPECRRGYVDEDDYITIHDDWDDVDERLTIWRCEACTTAGVVEAREGAGVYEVVEALRTAHHVASGGCELDLARIRVERFTTPGGNS